MKNLSICVLGGVLLAWPAGVVVPASVAAQDAAPAAEPEAAAGEAAVADDRFPSDQAKRSYAMGMFFAQRAKSSRPGDETIDVESFIEGVTAVLSGAKSADFAAGVSVGQSIASEKLEVDIETMLAGLRAEFGGDERKLSEAEMRTEIAAVQQELQQRRTEEREKARVEWEKKMEEVAPINTKEAEEFFARNRERAGVMQTESGLQYEVLAEGDGAAPKMSDRVTVNYTGTLLDDTVFDQSPEGQPRTFNVASVIKGWQEGLQLMKKGARYKFWIPGELAYGMTPRQGGVIEAMDALVFEVELVDVQTPQPRVTPPVSINPQTRKPATAVTPPVSVTIPPKKEGDAPPPADNKEGEEAGEKEAE